MVVFYLPPNLNSVIHLYFEDRERFERRINPTFSGPADKNRSDLLSRVRVGANYEGPKLSATLEYQYVHDLFWTTPHNGSTYASDASLAYVRYDTKPLEVIAGRQKIELGQLRLIGPTEWTTEARSFDAVLVGDGPWLAWGGKLGVANTKPETARVGDVTHVDKIWGTTSLIAKHDRTPAGSIDLETFDHLASYKYGPVTADAEGAYQVGHTPGLTQRAWALHFGLTGRLCSATTLSVEANSASGGSNGSTSFTFDNLYPSNHNLYGLADMLGWKNMNDLALKAENRSVRSLTLRAGVHAFSLRDASDAWYSGTGAVIFKDPTGQSGKNIGTEYDFEASYGFKRYGTLSAGIALLKPGDFVEKESGHGNSFTYGYVQYQIRL